MRKDATYYLAGPMSGIPQFNFPLFKRATEELREQGFTIISPHEQDTPEVQAFAWASPDGDTKALEAHLRSLGQPDKIETWGSILAKDVKLVADVIDGIIFLPRWSDSRGAVLEGVVGLLTEAEFRVYPELTVISDDAVINGIRSKLQRVRGIA